MKTFWLGLLLGLQALAGCRHGGDVPAATLQRLAKRPGSYLSGKIQGARDLVVLDDRDFVYAIAISPVEPRIAFVHLGPGRFELAVVSLTENGEGAGFENFPLNTYEKEVEGLAFSPDGRSLATAGRDGTVRFYAAQDLASLGEYGGDDPWVSVAFHPSGRFVALGGADGTLAVVSFPRGERVFRIHAHQGEIHGLAFSRDGNLFSGGWDRTLQVHSSEIQGSILKLKRFRRGEYGGVINDLTLDASGDSLGVAFSRDPAVRTPEIYAKEKKHQLEPFTEWNAAAIVDAVSGAVKQKWIHHHGVVSTATISPDGQALASGGWDGEVFVENLGMIHSSAKRSFDWCVRRTRFSSDGRFLGIAAWTPQNPVGDQRSAPSAVLQVLKYEEPEILGR